jgi:peptide/nickel transport system permease protein
MQDPAGAGDARRITRSQRVLKELLAAPLSAKLGLLIIFVYIFVALFAPWIAPYGESEIVGRKYVVWGDEFLLGTDNLGRDMFTRMVYGARNTVGIALVTTVYAFILGGILGIIAAVLGGWMDQLLSRTVDVLMAIPSLIFAMLLLSVFGTSVASLILIIGLLDATRIFRITRAVSLNVVVMDFVEAARLRGEGLGWITIREILPSISAPLAAEFGIRFCFVFLTISALSFLGLGIQPPTADWGSMVRDTADLITFEDYTPLIPAAAIAILTLGVNFVVDWFLHKTSGLKDDL